MAPNFSKDQAIKWKFDVYHRENNQQEEPRAYGVNSKLKLNISWDGPLFLLGIPKNNNDRVSS